jgi:hypothetical protein
MAEVDDEDEDDDEDEGTRNPWNRGQTLHGERACARQGKQVQSRTPVRVGHVPQARP